MAKQTERKYSGFLNRTYKSILRFWEYVSRGVWRDTRNNFFVNSVKTINLSVTCFFSGDLQTKACAMTFRTLLSIIPALALIFAIGRGFGIQDNIETELIHYFPAQEQLLRSSFGFVDSYLQQASGGVFVGVGIVFLLWTLISLLSSVEKAFNDIWQVPAGRSFWRKISDYTTIFILLPVLMIMSGGISLVMTTGLKYLLPSETMAPLISLLIDFAGIVLTWLFFTGTYILIPNVKVKFKNALLAGVLVGSAYQLLQWGFISGQLYVAKYNAIYGGFSFLPLFMIWLQLVWLLTLIGAVVCYSSQNINEFNFGDNIKNVSINYRRELSVIIMTIIAKRFAQNMRPLSVNELGSKYGIPINIVTPVVNRLRDIGLVNFVLPNHKRQSLPDIQPNINICDLTIKDVLDKINRHGDSNFIPALHKRYRPVINLYHDIMKVSHAHAEQIKLIDISIDV
ncbi:MAG: YihY/virulence factor BrkB family protein [Paramuribaculum sp.]|nr:YihY/virulence factor BrkB family protein [Paramuribaculum sp.]